MLKGEGKGIYCVYRQPGSARYPPTTPWLQLLIERFKKCNSNEEAVHICLHFIESAVKWFYNFKADIQSVIDLFEGKVTSDFSLNFGQMLNETLKVKAERIVRYCKDARIGLFSIVIDECHELLITPDGRGDLKSLYRSFRNAMEWVKDASIVAIFLGTKSFLHDFVLNPKRDPSQREEIIDPNQIIMEVPLYIFTHSIDVNLVGEFNVSHETASQMTLFRGKQLLLSKELQRIAIRCGRPLWECYGTYKKAFEVASSKLKSEESLYHLTCFVMRTGAEVLPQDHLAHKLVLSGMATLPFADTEGSRCLIKYIAEPILSNAARIKMSSLEFLSKAIKDYIRRLDQGAFHEAGLAGELIGRLVLLRVFDKCLLFERPQESTAGDIGTSANDNDVAELLSSLNENGTILLPPNLGVAKLKDFLMTLTGLDEASMEYWKFGVSGEVMEGLVSVNQFVHLEKLEKIDQVMLADAFIRSTGLILPYNAPGADSIIPVLCRDNKMTVIAVQVKNIGNSQFPYEKEKVVDGLSKLDFLDLKEVPGQFGAVNEEGFVRIVLQFREQVAKSFLWTEIKNSTPVLESEIAFLDESTRTRIIEEWDSLPKTRSNSRGPVYRRHVLWMLGMDSFSHLFCQSSCPHVDIMRDLNTIISGRRNLLNAIDFPTYELPTQLHSTRAGIELLGRLSSSWLHSDMSAMTNPVRASMLSEIERIGLGKEVIDLKLPREALKSRTSSFRLNYGSAATSTSPAASTELATTMEINTATVMDVDQPNRTSTAMDADQLIDNDERSQILRDLFRRIEHAFPGQVLPNS